MRTLRGLAALALTLVCSLALALPPEPPKTQDLRSAAAERVFADARPRLLQIRSVVRASGAQASYGSGFLVARSAAQALAITNYHVVSDCVLEPGQYALEWVSTGNQRGSVEILAIDIAHDLALIRIPSPPTELGTAFALAAEEPQRGEKVFSLGRPLDLGFNIVEGTHNGLVEGDFREQFLFSGAINPGMSGGPALSRRREVYGINVAVNLSGQLVSYVVPVRFAVNLLHSISANAPAPDGKALLRSITQQLKTRQSALLNRLFGSPLRQRPFGHFKVVDEATPLVRCWANSDGETESHPWSIDKLSCSSNADLFLGHNLDIGDVSYEHSLIRSRTLGALRFNALVTSQYKIEGPVAKRKHTGMRRCSDEFVTLGTRTWRVAFCAAALRKFEGLYLFEMAALSQDGAKPDANGERQALFSRLSVSGSSFEDAQKIARRFLEATR